MDGDFYIRDRRSLAGTFEREWFDHVARGGLPTTSFEFAPFDPQLCGSNNFDRVAALVEGALSAAAVAPTRYLEVGAGVGRGFYEILRRVPTLRTAMLVEPSQVLADMFERLFRKGGPQTFPVIRGNSEIVDIEFDGTHVREAVSALDISLLRTQHENLPRLGEFDLVTCFNVLDQCHAPLALVERLKGCTRPGGVLAVSCTYQWNEKYLRSNETPFRQLRDLFSNAWVVLSDENVEYRFRKVERYWWSFLSHVVILQRTT